MQVGLGYRGTHKGKQLVHVHSAHVCQTWPTICRPSWALSALYLAGAVKVLPFPANEKQGDLFS